MAGLAVSGDYLSNIKDYCVVILTPYALSLFTRVMVA